MACRNIYSFGHNESNLIRKGEKMNVIEYLPTLADAGAETLVKDYCILTKDRKDIHLIPITMWGLVGSANEKKLTENGVEIISIYGKKSKMLQIFNKVFGRIYIPLKLNRLIKQNNVEILHVHLPLLYQMRFLCKINKKIRFMYTCHNIPEHYFPNKECQEYRAAKALFSNNRLKIIALHDEMREELNELFNTDNTEVVHNAIDIERFLSCKITKEEKRKEIGIPEDAFVLGHIGRFANQKNHQFLVDVYEKVYAKNKNAFLLMIGEGELKTEIVEKLEKNNLHNYLILSKRTDVDELLRAMDVFVFPSRFEGLGIVLIEAQVSGIRCICSDAVPNDAYVSDLIYPISLETSVDEWAGIILDDTKKIQYPNRIDSYNMKKEINKLVNLYMKKGE